MKKNILRLLKFFFFKATSSFVALMLFSLSFFYFVSVSSCNNTKANVPSDRYRNYYEIFVRSFYDSDGNGLGDLKGVTLKLDYIKDDLGADGIWFMPIMPSPTYHKYDILDYYSIDPQYGTMEDFDELMEEASKRNIRVILDLVVNHTSNLHPWFSQAVDALWKDNSSKYIDYYNFSLEDQGEGYKQITDKYFYECRFVSNMPDLNLDSEDVRDEILKIAKFWLDKGVSGFRLDALTSLYTEDETKNIKFLTWLCKSIKEYKSDAYIVGEVWSNAATISNYYESGIDSLFNFPFSDPTGTIVNSLNTKNGENFAKELESWNKTIKNKNSFAADALFLSNHDNARSAGFLMRDTKRQKMAAAMYLLAPGIPFIYYGEEIGMTGSGIDENKRLPMLWSVQDKKGITYPPPNATQTVKDIKGVEEQLQDKDSLLRYYKKILQIKKDNPEIARGEVQYLKTNNPQVAALIFTYMETKVYVFHNFSKEKIEMDFDFKAKITHYISVTGSGNPVLRKGNLTLPPESTVITR